MEIWYEGKKLDETKEFEMFSKSKFGYNIEVHYVSNVLEGRLEGRLGKDYNKEFFETRALDLNGAVVTRFNCHEFHNLWKPDRIACESNHHSTGWVPWDLFEFEKIIITDAKEFSAVASTFHNKEGILIN